MLRPTILLVGVLVLGGGEAHSLTCNAEDARRLTAGDIAADEWSLRGSFVDLDRQTRVFLRVLPDEDGVHGCSLQHEDGSLSKVMTYYTGLVALCRDLVTGRDHVILSDSTGGSGDIPYLQYWSVQPETERATLEYRESVIMDDGDDSEPVPYPQLLVGADGQCLWRQHRTARDVFDGAMAALRTGVELDDEALTLALGDTLTLPTRAIPDDVVRHWLHALHTHTPAFATFETARYSGDSHTQPWRVLQILGRELCRAPGVVLLQDTRSGQWRSLYAVHSGCSKTLNFPLQHMVITGDTLFASACTDCSFWGKYGCFEIALPTNRVRSLNGAVCEKLRDLHYPGWDEYNPADEEQAFDLGKELGMD